MPVRANEGRSDHVVRIWSLINEEVRPPSNRNDARYISFLNSIPAGLRSVRGVKFTLRRDELAGLLPLLDEENNWLRANFGEEFCDEKIELTNDRPSLDDQTRAQLQAIATTTEPRVRQVINKYLAAYD